jgi:23S rRNA (adenine2503-C2)-methyltransferase
MLVQNKNEPMQHFLDHSYDSLISELVEKGEKKFRAKQIWQWVYQRGVSSFDEMSNIPAALRQSLSETIPLERLELSNEQISVDGTRKWLLALPDGNEIETVYIPEKHRGTLCVSSQVGCTLNCTFCHTGTQRLVRNLTAAEIIGQLLFAKDRLEDWNQEGQAKVTNIVLMGMGEPLLNYEPVKLAVLTMLDEQGLNLSKRRVTLSTSGIVPYIQKCGDEIGVNLAISLHACRDDLRDEIVPINKKYPLKELLESCKNYPASHEYRRITFEYVMLDQINDSDEDAHALIDLIKDIPAKVNLIPFNPWPGSPYQCSSKERIKAFSSIVEKAGYASPVRKPRGDDILAACGQLKSLSIKSKKGEV